LFVGSPLEDSRKQGCRYSSGEANVRKCSFTFFFHLRCLPCTVHSCHFSHSQLELELEQHITELETTKGLLRQKEEEAHKFQEVLQTSKDALWEVEKRMEYQEVELQSAQKSVSDMEKQLKLANQEVQDSEATVRQQETELARLREVLRRTEKELDERVAHLEQRCLFSEEERSMFIQTQ